MNSRRTAAKHAPPPPDAADTTPTDSLMTINWNAVASNISEARDELESIEASLAAGTPLDEVDFRVAMQHAYHHLNIAWNVRHESDDRYANMSPEDFDRWSRFPDDLAF